MKKIIILSLTLTISLIGCVAYEAETPGIEISTPAGFIGPSETMTSEAIFIPTITITPTERTCARVTAETALHVRSAADYESQVIGWLRSGEVVHVVGDIDSTWWRIERGELRGYVRAMYLIFSQCWDD